MKSFSTQSFFQLGFFSEKKERLFHLLQEHLQQKTSLLTIATPNPEQIVLSQENAEFSHHLQQFDVLLPDGQGLIWASRILGQPIQQRIPGVEVVEWLLENTKETVLIVGGKGYDQFSPLSSGQAISNFQFSNSIIELQIKNRQVFWTQGYEDIKNPTDTEEKAIEDVIKKVEPAIVLVALGAPWQEQWVIQHQALLKQQHVSIVMVVGGAIDMILGKVVRAPEFIQNLGLEWVFRLIQEPWRWKRQLRLIKFIFVLFLRFFRLDSQ